MVSSSNNEVISYLKNLGVRPSIQRIAIMEYLFANRIHPTADRIFEDLSRMMPTLSKTTVYNTLSLLSEKGAILSLSIDSRQVRYDGDTSVHGHFLCENCAELYDIFLTDTQKESIPKPEGTIHVINDVQLYYRGICEKCNKKKSN